MRQALDRPVRQFYVLLEGRALAQRPRQGAGHHRNPRSEAATVLPGSLVSAAAFLSSTRARAAVRAAEPCVLAAFGPAEMEALLVRDGGAAVELLLAAAAAMAPVIRRFISLGLNRVWLTAGDTVYRQVRAARLPSEMKRTQKDPDANASMAVVPTALPQPCVPFAGEQPAAVPMHGCTALPCLFPLLRALCPHP